MKRTIILVILDGWGVGKPDDSNPVHVVNPQNIAYLNANFPSGILQASGISVGLPWSEEGNSEVGHLNLGAGRIIYQYLPRITLAINDGSLFKNKALIGAFEHAQKNNSAVNFVGLLSEGNVHSSLEHLNALIQFAKEQKITKLNLHLFSDGRDSPPTSLLNLLTRISGEVNIASLSGRFYGMDREQYWDRTQKAYSVLIGDGEEIDSIENHVKKNYERKFSDEFIEPVIINSEGAIKENDAIVFFNFREDRIRQMTSAFINPQFDKFPVKSFKNLYVTTMTQYDKSFNVPVIFPPEKIDTCLSGVLSEKGKMQLKIAETQKYPHITYFFNGAKEEPFKNEYRILIPSKAIVHQEKDPAMMAQEITTRLVQSISEGVFDFILVNYANSDIVAHTGDYNACLEAVRIIDKQIEILTQAVLATNAVLIVTSDHGNIERVFDPLTGLPETKHDSNPVPIYLVAKEFQRQKSEVEAREAMKQNLGILADVAPTILELMKIPQPKEMTGQSLLKFLI
ncbi:2,3-bisphosphoglycerate-independent phosphoglycerate mutase [Candidatus Wolfebacteria bacterium]|nr:2,3-bisphosphoglycerate-independent phosphoglycerate mutase [Candidatus Wolfebacteria bacterium]